MKRTYTIEITEPDDRQSLEIIMKADDLWMVISDLLEELRQRCKYGEGDTTQYEEIRKLLWDDLGERGVTSLFT